MTVIHYDTTDVLNCWSHGGIMRVMEPMMLSKADSEKFDFVLHEQQTEIMMVLSLNNKKEILDYETKVSQ